MNPENNKNAKRNEQRGRKRNVMKGEKAEKKCRLVRWTSYVCNTHIFPAKAIESEVLFDICNGKGTPIFRLTRIYVLSYVFV